MDRRRSRQSPQLTWSDSLLLGIDIGTTLTKVGVVGLDGSEIIQSAVPTPWRSVSSGGQLLPEELLSAVSACASDVLSQAPPGHFVGVGVTSMAETIIMLDATSTPVGPAVAWFDVRAQQEFMELKNDLGADTIGRITGLATSQIPTIATLKWLRRNVPECREAVSFAGVADWIVHCLGGELSAELSLASRTGALAVQNRRWWAEGAEWAGLRSEDFLSLRSAGTSFGRVKGALPGLERLEGAVLTSAGHDHLCASVGVGVNQSSRVLDSCGTAEALVRAVPVTALDDLRGGHRLGIEIGWHVVPDHYALIGGLALGLNFLPVLKELGVESRHGLTKLDRPAMSLLADLPDVLVSMDQVSSLRKRLDVSSTLKGHANESPERIWLGVVSASVAGARQLLNGLEELGGPIADVRVSGGWSRNPLLQMLKEKAFPPMSYPVVTEAGIRGAALLSALAAGVYSHSTEFPEPWLESISSGREDSATTY